MNLPADFDNILIIDDGSDTESKKIYSKIPKKVKIIYHDKNMGKGCALKTGIATIKKEDAFITVDSDGQHKVKDILKIKDTKTNCAAKNMATGIFCTYIFVIIFNIFFSYKNCSGATVFICFSRIQFIIPKSICKSK